MFTVRLFLLEVGHVRESRRTRVPVARREGSRPDLIGAGGPAWWTIDGVERNTVTRRVLRRSGVPAAFLALIVGLSACSSATNQLEEGQLAQGSAAPAESPQVFEPEGGELVPVPGSVRAVVALGDRVAVQSKTERELGIGRVDGTSWIPEHTVELPADAGIATGGDDGSVVVPYTDGVVVVSPKGASTQIAGLGPVTAAAVTPDGKLITGTAEGEVVIRDAEGVEEKRLGGLTSVDALSVARDGSITALSRTDTVIASIDPSEEVAGPLLRAGRGAGMMGDFGQGTVIASDTVGNTLLVYSTSPVRLHQQFPAGAAPWAVAEDPSRSVVWVTSTGTNTVQAYDLGDGIGILRAEIPTVRQPDALAVTDSGTVVVGSSDGAGLHLIRPNLVDPVG